jgi:hypothetical protein
MCWPHWKKLPKHLRDAVWAAYIPGQEIRKDPTPEYMKVSEAARRWLAAAEGRRFPEVRFDSLDE